FHLAWRQAGARAGGTRSVRSVREAADAGTGGHAASRVARGLLAHHDNLMARNTSFYYAFLVLPAEQRRAIGAVWDFCRAVDDVVDEGPVSSSGPLTGHEAVCFWRTELARCFGVADPQTPEGQRLRPFIKPLDLPRQSFEDLI